MDDVDIPLEVDDAVVLILGGPSRSPQLRDRLEGITRLEKLVYLLQHETPIGRLFTEDPGFIAYNFGPYSSKIYQAIDTLRMADLITDSESSADSPDDVWETESMIGDANPYTARSFALTERGQRYYSALIAELPKGTDEELRDFKDQFAGLPLRNLVRYVYQRHPDMTENSLIKDDILGT